jgi:hypothetical protein
VDYAIVASPKLHGQRASLGRRLARLGQLPEWARCAVVFLDIDIETDASSHDHLEYTEIDCVLEYAAGAAACRGGKCRDHPGRWLKCPARHASLQPPGKKPSRRYPSVRLPPG